jgi:hypothetical protein
MTNSSYNAHTNPLFKKHKILPYDLLIKQAQLSFMHTIEHNLAPASFRSVWVRNNEREPNFNLRNATDFYIPLPRTETFKKSTYYALPTIWNSLSPYLKYQPNKITFKWALKAHLLDELPDD